MKIEPMIIVSLFVGLAFGSLIANFIEKQYQVIIAALDLIK